MRHTRPSRSTPPFASPSRALATACALAAIACGGQSGAITFEPDSGSAAVPDAGPVSSNDAGTTGGPDSSPGAFDSGPSDDGSTHPGSSSCKAPVPVIVGGIDTGYDSCQGGTLRRRAVVACPVLPIPASKCLPDAGIPGECTSNADCTSGQSGACTVGSGFDGPSCECTYGCVHDSDCGSGSICVCGDPVGHCETSACNAGTCGAGLDCADETSEPGCDIKAFACTTPSDECFSDSDCSQGSGTTCSAGVPPGVRKCSPPTCAF
jgi:hypothetical protein